MIRSIQGVYAQGMTAKSDKVATARAMAEGAIRHSAAQVALAVPSV